MLTLNAKYKNMLRLSPLLVLYLVLILVFATDVVIGDGNRYLGYAENLLQGFYTNSDNPDLSNGPGYPLVLLPFVALNINLIVLKLLNGFFIFIGVFYFFKTLNLYTKYKYALIFAYILGLYPPVLRWMTSLYSESLAFMLMSGLIFHLCYMYQNKNQRLKNSILASLYLGFLILTKVVFFHAMVTSALLLVIFFLVNKNSKPRWTAYVLLGATVLITPFILYAYSVTGKLFYLGTRGGEILYHRSTPFEDEWGNWFSYNSVLDDKETSGNTASIYNDLSELSANHRDFYLQLEPLSNMERDSVFKAKAYANMKEHPMKYVKNTIANIGRLLFNYPISYRSQNLNAYGYMLPNMFIVVLFVLSIYPGFVYRKRIPFEIKAVLFFALIYCGGMILLGGKGRYFVVAIPSIVLFFVFVFTKIIKISYIPKQEKI